MTIRLSELISAANAKTKKPRKTAFKHRVTTRIKNGKFTTVFLTDEGLAQYNVAEWLRWHKIEFLHIPNEAKRSGLDGFMLGLLGLTKGASDLLIFTPPPLHPSCHGTAIEMKSLAGTASEDQLKWQEKMSNLGWVVAVCQGSDKAIDFLESLGYGQTLLK